MKINFNFNFNFKESFLLTHFVCRSGAQAPCDLCAVIWAADGTLTNGVAEAGFADVISGRAQAPGSCESWAEIR
jgi:hypothetical protein